MKHYEKEACERWGNTEAFCEHTEKTKNYTKEKWAEVNVGAIRPSRFSGKPQNFKPASRPSPAGPPRLSNTKSTTAMEY